MGSGPVCKCDESTRAVKYRAWRVHQRYHNNSSFERGGYAASDWSSVFCLKCRRIWRTKATYVSQLKDATKKEFFR